MAVGHRSLPHYGVQFHPESVATGFGPALLRNFRDLAAGFWGLPEQPPVHNLPGVANESSPGSGCSGQHGVAWLGVRGGAGLLCCPLIAYGAAVLELGWGNDCWERSLLLFTLLCRAARAVLAAAGLAAAVHRGQQHWQPCPQLGSTLPAAGRGARGGRGVGAALLGALWRR